VPEIVILDPRAEETAAEKAAAPRLRSLQGAVVGILSNHKANADLLFDRIAEHLTATYGVAEVRRWEKPAASMPAADAVYGEMAATCAAAVVGVGD